MSREALAAGFAASTGGLPLVAPQTMEFLIESDTVQLKTDTQSSGLSKLNLWSGKGVRSQLPPAALRVLWVKGSDPNSRNGPSGALQLLGSDPFT